MLKTHTPASGETGTSREHGFSRPSWVARGRRPQILATMWACILPLDRFLEIPEVMINLLRYSGVGLLVLAAPATLRGESRQRLSRLFVLLFALGAVRIAMGQYHDDPAGRMIGFVLIASVLACALLAWRPQLHRNILLGYLVGASISATVSLMQAVDIPTLRPPGPGASRYPGLASSTMTFTWQVTFASIIAIYFIATAPRASARWRCGAAALPVCTLAMMGSGAQGGFLGTAAAILAFIIWCPPGTRKRLLSRGTITACVALVIVGTVAMMFTPLRPSTFDDWSQGDYVNELARLEIARTGWSVFVEHPVTGVGREQFFTEHDIAPHFLPLESAASAGIVAGLFAAAVVGLTWAYMLRGPARGRCALFGSVMLAAMSAHTLIETPGPYLGVTRMILLVVVLVAATGDNDPPESIDDSEEPNQATTPRG